MNLAASEPTALAELVAPLTQAEFLTILRQRKLTLLRAAAAAPYTSLLDWNGLRGVIEAGRYPLEKFCVQRESVKIPAGFYSEKGRACLRKFDELLRAGVSIIMESIEQQVPTLAALCENIRMHVPESISIGAIVTTGPGGAIELHYDEEDLLILQIEGSKRWEIYLPTVSNPVKGMSQAMPPQGAPIFDEVLEAGDRLFLPAGYWHHCRNGPGRSMHLGVFFQPWTAWTAARNVIAPLRFDELFREPLSRLDDATQLERIEAAVKDRLIDAIKAMSLAETITRMQQDDSKG